MRGSETPPVRANPSGGGNRSTARAAPRARCSIVWRPISAASSDRQRHHVAAEGRVDHLANEAYQAASAVASPIQPPSLMMLSWPPASPMPSTMNVIAAAGRTRRDRGRGAQRRDEHVRREDAPGDQVQPDGVAGVVRSGRRREELHEGPERQPERAVGRERGRAERVAGAELPHAGEQLREPAIGEREAEHDRLAARADKPGVEHAEHERGERERGEAERRRGWRSPVHRRWPLRSARAARGGGTLRLPWDSLLPLENGVLPRHIAPRADAPGRGSITGVPGSVSGG